MINGGSASASEIMAAAMQDYGRAVIVGSRSYGKGTVQKLIPLDEFVNHSIKEKLILAYNKAKGADGGTYDGIGSLKLTIQKFYRINGGSTQLKGVTPDIPLPDTYEYLDMGERQNESALPWDKIDPAKFTPWKSQPPIAALKADSKKRVAGDETFKIVKMTGEKVKEQHDHNIAPLNLKAFEAKKKESEALSEKVNRLDSLGSPLIVKNLKVDLPKVNIDTASKVKNQDWLKALKKDVYIYETTNVLKDWISQMPQNINEENEEQH